MAESNDQQLVTDSGEFNLTNQKQASSTYLLNKDDVYEHQNSECVE